MSKKQTTKLYWYTWKVFSCYGYVKAKNLTNAICKAIKNHYGKNSKEKSARFDMYVKKGKHNVY